MASSTTGLADADGVGTPFHILALSGGGFRGLYTAKILADLEQHAGRPIARCFDLIAGTSIGGIIALALALEVPAERMVALFARHGEAIFKERWSLRGMWRSPYTQDALRGLLVSDDLFGNRVLGECAHRVLVPSINYTTGSPVVFKTPHHDNFSRDWQLRMVDIALATSAAPGFFPRHTFNNCQYIDGGLFANAPGLVALHEATHFLDTACPDVRLVAIGTMSSRFTVDPRRNRQGGTYDWGGLNPSVTPKRLFGVSISAQEQLVDNLLTHQLPSSQYHHIDDEAVDQRARAIALDRADAAAREVLLGAGAERAKWCLGNTAFRALLQHQAAQPTFFHGPRANFTGSET